MILFKHRRSAERDTFSVPHSVQKSIPIKRIYQDGVFQVSGKFSKTWRFFDVNYAVASPEKQRELFMTYCSFLNSLPIGATAKITLFNRQLNQKDFGRTLLMPMQGDRRDLYRNEYNALVLGKAAESNNLIQEKYITVSAEKKSEEEARAFFSRVGTDLTTGLSRMSSSVREITVNDRLRLLHDFYRPGETISGIGSSAAILYYNDKVSYLDGTVEPMNLQVLPIPKTNGADALMTQAGVGLCAYKTDEQRAEAASLFVHWLTEPERNLDFVAETGYMPVRNGAFDAIEDYTDFPEPQQAYQNLYAALNTMRQEYTPVSEPRFSGYYGKVNALYDALRETQKDYPARLASGESVDELANETWTMLCSMG